MLRTEHHYRAVHLRRAGFLGIRRCESEMALKWADRLSEVDQAFSLVYEEYFRSGYITEPNASRIYFNFHNLLPSSSTLVIQKEDRIVATLSMVFDTREFGLPSDSLYCEELAPLRRQGRTLAEICSLAISPQYRLGNLIMPMFRAVYWLSLARGLDNLCIMVNPKHASFYKMILLFDQLGPERMYPRVGAPAVCLTADVRGWDAKAQKAYSGMELLHNVRDYFIPDMQYISRFATAQGIFNRYTVRHLLIKEKRLLSVLRPQQFDFLMPLIW